MKVFKAVRGTNFIAVVMYRSQHNSAAGEVKELLQVKVKKWHRVYSGLLDVPRSFFSWLLAKEFDGFPLAFSPRRVQGKPKVACFCIVLFYVHIEILAVLVPVI